MWILHQTPCSHHPVSRARPHPWGYYQIIPWTAYRDAPEDVAMIQKVIYDSTRPYCWRMPVDIPVWMYKHLCLKAALISVRLVVTNELSPPWQQTSRIIIANSWGVPCNDAESNIEIVKLMEGKAAAKKHCSWTETNRKLWWDCFSFRFSWCKNEFVPI